MSEIKCISSVVSRLAESPLWDKEQQVLYWVDIDGKKLHSLNWITNSYCCFNMAIEIGCIALASNGCLIAALKDGIAFINKRTGKIKWLSQYIHRNDLVMFNDGKCDRAGRFWVGTKDIALKSPIASFFCFEGSDACREVERGFAVVNGFAWSPDNKKMYISDSLKRIIYRYDYDLSTGNIFSREIFTKVPEESGYPDGLTVDEEGYIWCAHWGGGCVTRYFPDGSIERTIPMPVLCPTSCCFGGPNLTTLFITSAIEDGNAKNISAQSGCVFALDVGIRGIAETHFGKLNENY